MRRFMMLSAVVGSLAGLGAPTAEAAPVAGAVPFAIPLATQADAQVETVQYRCGPRCQEARRREWRRRNRHYGRRRY